jgi:hypothetical protein
MTPSRRRTRMTITVSILDPIALLTAITMLLEWWRWRVSPPAA